MRSPAGERVSRGCAGLVTATHPHSSADRSPELQTGWLGSSPFPRNLQPRALPPKRNEVGEVSLTSLATAIATDATEPSTARIRKPGRTLSSVALCVPSLLRATFEAKFLHLDLSLLWKTGRMHTELCKILTRRLISARLDGPKGCR